MTYRGVVPQAAGRIHRLGQTRGVLVKRLVYRNSIEGAILHLHAQILAGQLQIVDQVWPHAALEQLLADDA